MAGLAAFEFLQPGWLLLLPLPWLLALFYGRSSRRRSMWHRVCDPRLLRRMAAATPADERGRGLPWLLAIIFSLGLIAAAGPAWRPDTNPVMESASARIVALDLSRAMLVEDVRPSRYRQALAAARGIIDDDFDGETGLVVFAGAAFTVSPLSRDANTLLAFVDALEPGILPLDGARLDLAIERARDLLAASVFGRGQIIAITTGSDDPGAALAAAQSARADGHRLSILAIGTAAGGPMLDGDGGLMRDGDGRPILARTDFDALARVALSAGGVMVPLRRASTYDALLASQVAVETLVEAEGAAQRERRGLANEGFWLVWLMLPFAWLLFRRNLLWLLLLCYLPLPQPSSAADSHWFWLNAEKRAFEAYQEDRYRDALELTRAPLLLGAVHYRLGDYQQALESFSRDDSAAGWHNRGNSLAQLQRYEEAVEAYSRALALDPGLGDARHNRRLLELHLLRRQQGDAADSGDPGEEGSAQEALDDSRGLSRIGVLGESMINPADQQQAGPGIGASAQSGLADPGEHFDGGEQQLDRFLASGDVAPEVAAQVFEQWISRLPATSSELYQRKFLRDYQRQRRESR